MRWLSMLPAAASILGIGSAAGADPGWRSRCARGKTLRGIDVSKWQGDIDWDAVRGDGVDFAFIRVSDGAARPDPTFARNWSEAARVGLARGAYQYFRPLEDPEEQADLLLEAIGPPDARDLPAVIDVEVSDGVAPREMARLITRWSARVYRATGVRPLIYTSAKNWSALLGGSRLFRRHALWVAHYDTDCPNTGRLAALDHPPAVATGPGRRHRRAGRREPLLRDAQGARPDEAQADPRRPGALSPLAGDRRRRPPAPGRDGRHRAHLGGPVMAIPTLYVFTISHFAEKARWALDHKQVRYRPVVLLPGPHQFTTRRIAGATQVPLLVHDGVPVSGSSAIIDHADRVWRERPLTPAGREEEAAELERSLDDELGENGRRVLYSYALDRPDVTVPLFTAGGPRWGSLFYRVAYRTIARIIRSRYRVHDDEVARSKESFAQAIARLESRLHQGRYLLGDALSRVDITAAALLAPMVAPPEHPCQKWADVRAALPGWHAWASTFDGSPVADWVRRVYREHREM